MTKKLTKKQVEQLRKRLLDEKQSLVFNSMSSDEFSVLNEGQSDEVDRANADVSNAERLRFRNREVFYAKKIDQALQRIADQNYGECLDCGEYIRKERLIARPTADLCILCKEEAEKDESNNFIARQSKSLGKSLELAASN